MSSEGIPNLAQLQEWLTRIQAGDRFARDELLGGIYGNLERLTRKMLRRYPSLQQWVEAADVLQSALVRLMRALEEVKPGSLRDFFSLATEQIRRELIDLSRQHYGPCGDGTRAAEQPRAGDPPGEVFEPAAVIDDPYELETWCEFHEAVEDLPTAEREVVGLVYYHGWTQVQVAELFGVTERTVRRRLQTALDKLRHQLQAGG
jgi:RNA polymerase sigma-70 factor (ECF subfamily)